MSTPAPTDPVAQKVRAWGQLGVGAAALAVLIGIVWMMTDAQKDMTKDFADMMKATLSVCTGNKPASWGNQ